MKPRAQFSRAKKGCCCFPLEDHQDLRYLVASASSSRLAWERVGPSASQIIPACLSGPGSPAL